MRLGCIALFALILQGGCNVAGRTPEARVTRLSTLLTTRQRSETHDDEIRVKSSTVERTTRRYIELLGSTFEDLPPAEQRAVMAEAGADAVVTTRLILGAKESSWEKSQDVEVVVRLGVSAADAMAWAVRCRAAAEDFSTTNRAIEHAARCAIAAARVANRQR